MPSSPVQKNDQRYAIEVHELSKCYRIYDHPRDRILQGIWPKDRWGRAKQRYREFWALRKISFGIESGQTLGIVGRNGSGKSTLLQLICGTLQPTTGSVKLSGRVGALLELGSGFNPEFSGLENVYLNAALLGMSKQETEDKLDQILGFADIGDYIHQPIKSYSSGMHMRLAFSVQAHIEPNVLVVDEALAVGDELFQKKCYDHLRKLKESGSSILLVTHSCPQIIQHCDQALLLHKGKARMLGRPAPVTVTYQKLMNASDDEWEQEFSDRTICQAGIGASEDEMKQSKPVTSLDEGAWFDSTLVPHTTEIYPSNGGEIIDCWIESTSGERVNVLGFAEPFIIVFSYAANTHLKSIGMACHIASHTGLRVTGQTLPPCISSTPGHHIEKIDAGSRWQVRYAFNGSFWPGVYFVGGGMVTCQNGMSEFIHRVIDYRAFRILASGAISVIGTASLQARPPEIIGIDSSAET